LIRGEIFIVVFNVLDNAFVVVNNIFTPTSVIARKFPLGAGTPA